MTSDRPAILVDLDGTLLDTNYLHTIAWWRAFRDAGEQVAMSRIHPLIGMGSEQLVHHLLGREDKQASDGHSRHFDALKDEITAFPGAADLLRELSGRGARVLLATSSDEEDLRRLRDALDADEAIEDAVSKGDVEHGKPSPDVFQAALERFDIDPSQAMVVGDTRWDIEAAGKVGLQVVCVLTGGATREQLMEAGAVAVYDDVAELLRMLDESPLAQVLNPR